MRFSQFGPFFCTHAGFGRTLPVRLPVAAGFRSKLAAKRRASRLLLSLATIYLHSSCRARIGRGQAMRRRRSEANFGTQRRNSGSLFYGWLVCGHCTVAWFAIGHLAISASRCRHAGRVVAVISCGSSSAVVELPSVYSGMPCCFFVSCFLASMARRCGDGCVRNGNGDVEEQTNKQGGAMERKSRLYKYGWKEGAKQGLCASR